MKEWKMKKFNNFLFVEKIIMGIFVLWFICFVIGITSIVIYAPEQNSSISWGINGVTESRCIDGYKFIIGQGGQQVRQVIDENGKAIRCD